jgi:hypothetical protein
MPLLPVYTTGRLFIGCGTQVMVGGVASTSAVVKANLQVFCLAEAKLIKDREFMRKAVMCSHVRDERDGRLAILCRGAPVS